MLLAWWFLIYLSAGPTTVGPFRNEQECQGVRRWADPVMADRNQSNRVSWCWWDGKQ